MPVLKVPVPGNAAGTMAAKLSGIERFLFTYVHRRRVYDGGQHLLLNGGCIHDQVPRTTGITISVNQIKGRSTGIADTPSFYLCRFPADYFTTVASSSIFNVSKRLFTSSKVTACLMPCFAIQSCRTGKLGQSSAVFVV